DAPSNHLAGGGGGAVAGVGGAGGFDEEKGGFLFGDGLVLHAAGDDVEVAGAEGHVAFGHADGETAREDEKEVVRVLVVVGYELAEGLDDHDVVAVEGGDGARCPMIRKLGEFVRQVDRAAHIPAPWFPAITSRHMG